MKLYTRKWRESGVRILDDFWHHKKAWVDREREFGHKVFSRRSVHPSQTRSRS